MSRLSEAIQEADRRIKDVLLQQKQVEVLLDAICKKYGIKSFMTLDQFYKLRTIDSYLPLEVYPERTFEHIETKCGSCDKVLQGNDLRGTIEKVERFGYREAVVLYHLLDAQGYCKQCNKLTPINYHLISDLSIEGISPYTGKWSRWEAEDVRPTLLQRVKKWFWKQKAKPNELSI